MVSFKDFIGIYRLLQAQLQQYMNRELLDDRAGSRKGRGTRDQIAKHLLDHRKNNSRKAFASASLTMLKPLTVWITTNWKILEEMGIPDYLTFLLRSLYAGQEATVRTYGTTDWERSTSRLYIVTLRI